MNLLFNYISNVLGFLIVQFRTLISGERVFVKLKPYNSYCVAKLWLGFASGNRKEGSLDPHQIGLMKEVHAQSQAYLPKCIER